MWGGAVLPLRSSQCAHRTAALFTSRHLPVKHRPAANTRTVHNSEAVRWEFTSYIAYVKFIINMAEPNQGQEYIQSFDC